MTNHQELRDNIPAYALGILETDQAEELSAHIASCASCQAELQAMLHTADLLGHGALDAQPRAELKQQVFAQIQSTVEDKPSDKAGWLQRLFGEKPAFALVSMGLIVLLAVSNLLLWNQVQDFKALNFGTINLSATDTMPEAKGMIVISADGQYGTLVASDLEKLSEAEQYQLWLIKDGERTSGGVFSVSERGYAALKIYAQEPLDSFDGFGITIEPEGGSPGPTGPKILGTES